MIEYTPEEHLAAQMLGVSDPAELYELQVLRVIHQVIHTLQSAGFIIEQKTSWPDVTKQRFKHITDFFVQDITAALVNEVTTDDNSNPDSGNPEAM